jgi:hypothetical protein
MKISTDLEFRHLIPPLRPDELQQLEDNILRDGCLEPLSIWRGLLIDGHNRLRVCRQHDVPFKVEEIALPDREHAKAWIAERQLGRRNLTDDQRAAVTNDHRKILSRIARKERARVAGKAGGRNHPKVSLSVKSADKLKPKQDTRKAVAREANLSEYKLRIAQQIDKADPRVLDMVRTGGVRLIDGKRLAALPKGAVRNGAIAAIKRGTDVRSAIRAARKQGYCARVSAAKPKGLEGTYRIFYADRPGNTSGLMGPTNTATPSVITIA